MNNTFTKQIFTLEYNNETYYYVRENPIDDFEVKHLSCNKIQFIGIFKCTTCNGNGFGAWRPANGICYKCKGSGYNKIILNVTKHKQIAQRRLQAILNKQEVQQQENIQKRRQRNLNKNLYLYSNTFYIILDTKEHSTYLEKEYLKSKNARWNPDWGCWYVKYSESVENDFKNFKLYKISLKNIMNEDNYIDWLPIRKAVMEERQKLSKGDV